MKNVVADGLSRLCENRVQSTVVNLLYSCATLTAAADADFNFEERSKTYLGIKVAKLGKDEAS